MTLRDLFLIGLASLGLAIVALWFSLHTAKSIAGMQQHRMEQVERDVALEDGLK